jgi:hypothetical protein
MENNFGFDNGINGATGEYLFPQLTPKEISAIAQGTDFDRLHLSDLRTKAKQTREKKKALKAGKDPDNLADAGWGVIFAREYKDSNRYAAEAIREALSPLLDRRQQQATRYYREYIGSKAYHPGETKVKFLQNRGAGSGAVDPERMPYYLLIVADPETIPYHFQYQLDVQYAVGRIYFDTLDEYAQYASSVVEAETGKLSLPKQVAFFGVRNNGDQATQYSADRLVKPLADWLRQEQPDWSVPEISPAESTKEKLSQLMGGAETPALLFTASHGVAFPKDHPRQFPHQGALLCQNWPGPLKWKGELNPDEHYFAADDIGNDANVKGLIAFHFACFGAGTPKFNSFSRRANSGETELAPYSFMARLPQRLLSRGALAVIGHVDRALSRSFFSARAGKQLAVFESAFKTLIAGKPLGFAMEYFNQKYAELSSDLQTELEGIENGKAADDDYLADLWTSSNDARNYAIIGDPAVRLAVGNSAAATTTLRAHEVVVLKASEEPRADTTQSQENQDKLIIQDESVSSLDEFKSLVTDLAHWIKNLEQQVQKLQEQNHFLQQQIDRLQQSADKQL